MSGPCSACESRSAAFTVTMVNDGSQPKKLVSCGELTCAGERIRFIVRNNQYLSRTSKQILAMDNFDSQQSSSESFQYSSQAEPYNSNGTKDLSLCLGDKSISRTRQEMALWNGFSPYCHRGDSLCSSQDPNIIGPCVIHCCYCCFWDFSEDGWSACHYMTNARGFRCQDL